MLICFGVGMLIATFLNVKLIDVYTTEAIVAGVTHKTCDWNTIWAIMTAISALLLAAFSLVFRDDAKGVKSQQA